MIGWRIYVWILMDHYYHYFIQMPEQPGCVRCKGRWPIAAMCGTANGGSYLETATKWSSCKKVTAPDYKALTEYISLNSVRARLIRSKAGGGVLENPKSSIAGGKDLPPKRRAK